MSSYKSVSRLARIIDILNHYGFYCITADGVQGELDYTIVYISNLNDAALIDLKQLGEDVELENSEEFKYRIVLV